MSKALLLIDYENEWVDPKSEYFVGDISPVLDRTNRLIRYCRSNGYKIIFTTHIEETSTQEFTFKDLKETREEIAFLDLEDFIND